MPRTPRKPSPRGGEHAAPGPGPGVDPEGRPDWGSQLEAEGYVDFSVDRRKLLGITGSVVFALALGVVCGIWSYVDHRWYITGVGLYLVLQSTTVLLPRMVRLRRLQGPLLRVDKQGLHLAGDTPLDIGWHEITDVEAVSQETRWLSFERQAHARIWVASDLMAAWRARRPWWRNVGEVVEFLHRADCVYLPKALPGSAVAIADWLREEWVHRGPWDD